MSRREFADSGGVQWTVFDVAASPGPSDGAPTHPAKMQSVTAWLLFESANEHRRFSPPPLAWDELSPEELERLLRYATPV